MISDVMWQGIEDLKRALEKVSKDSHHYLDDPFYDSIYGGKLRKRIEAVVKEMDAIRVILDNPPK